MPSKSANVKTERQYEALKESNGRQVLKRSACCPMSDAPTGATFQMSPTAGSLRGYETNIGLTDDGSV